MQLVYYSDYTACHLKQIVKMKQQQQKKTEIKFNMSVNAGNDLKRH